MAGGVAVGLFTGLIPGSNPVQFFFAALFAVVFRVNLPVAIITTLYSNPFTILPIYAAAYAIGAFVTGNGAGALPQAELHLMDKSIGEWIPALVDWVVALGKPLLVGLVLLALLLSIGGYVLVRGGWRLYTVYNGASARNAGDGCWKKHGIARATGAGIRIRKEISPPWKFIPKSYPPDLIRGISSWNFSFVQADRQRTAEAEFPLRVGYLVILPIHRLPVATCAQPFSPALDRGSQ